MDFVKLVLELEMLCFCVTIVMNFIAHLQKPYVAVYFLIYGRGIETFNSKCIMAHGEVWSGNILFTKWYCHYYLFF